MIMVKKGDYMSREEKRVCLRKRRRQEQIVKMNMVIKRLQH